MVLLSRHVDSPEDMQPGTIFQCRYPTRHHSGGTVRIGEKGKAVLLPGQMETRTWEEEGAQRPHQGEYRGQQTPLMKKGSNRPAPCS